MQAEIDQPIEQRVKLGLSIPTDLMARIKQIAFVQRRSVTSILVEQLEKYDQEFKQGLLDHTKKREVSR